MAYSKFGAAGIWQFTRDTGRHYLKINYAIDERLDPIKSTHAALEHLQGNYNELRSWPLAIIAYNYGLAGMRRAVEGLDTTDVVDILCRHKGRTFGFASRNFYCEFLAASEIAENYREYFGEIDIEKSLQFQAYRLKKDVLLKDIMKYTGLEKGVIKKYNPAIRKPAILSERHLPKDFDLKLPDDRDYQLDAFFMDYRSLKPVQVASLDKSPRKKSVIQREPVIPREPIALDKALITNEDAFSIKSASASELLNVSLPSITPLEDVIRSRSKPIMVSGSVIPGESMIASQSVIAHESLFDIPSPFIEGPPVPQNIGAGRQRYNDLVKVDKQFVWLRVIPNETIGHYAEWGRTGSWEIRRLNGMEKSGSHVKIGNVIRIRLNNVTPEEFQNARADYHRGIEEDFFDNYQVKDVYEYEIKRGDSIWALCMSVFDVPQWLIERYNSTIDLDNLIPGTRIAVPNVVQKPKGIENGFNGNPHGNSIRGTSIAGWQPSR